MWWINSISGGLWLLFSYENEVTLTRTLILNEFDDKTRFFSLSRFLTFCKSNFFLFLNFLIFVFFLSRSLPRTHATPHQKYISTWEDFSKWSSKRATRTLDSDTAALASWHFQPYKSRSSKQHLNRRLSGRQPINDTLAWEQRQCRLQHHPGLGKFGKNQVWSMPKGELTAD